MAPCQSTTYTTKRPPSSSVTTHYAMNNTMSAAIEAKTKIDPLLSRHTLSSSRSSSSLPRVSLVENPPQNLPPPLVLHRSKRRTVAFAVNIEKLDIPVAPVRARSSQHSLPVPYNTTVETLSHAGTTTQSSVEGARETSPKTVQRTDVDNNNNNTKIDDEELGGPSTTATTTEEEEDQEKNHSGSNNNSSSSIVNDRPIQTTTAITTTITTTTHTTNNSNNTNTNTKTNDDVVEKKKKEGGLGLNLTISTPMLDAGDPLSKNCSGGPVPVSPHTSCTLDDPMTAALAALLPPTVPFPILKKRKRGRPSRADKLLMIAAEEALAKAAAATAIASGLPIPVSSTSTAEPTFEAAFVAASTTVAKGRRRRSLVSGIPSSLLPPPPPQPKVQRVKYDMEAVPLVQVNPTMWEQFRNQKVGDSSSSSVSPVVLRPPPMLAISSSEDEAEQQRNDTKQEEQEKEDVEEPFLKESVVWIPESRKDWEDTISEMKSVCTSAAYRRWCAAQESNNRNINNNNSHVHNTTTTSHSKTTIIPSLLSSSKNSKVLATNAASGAAVSTAPTTTAAAPIFIPPLQQSFIKDRMKYDDPLRGYQVRHTTGGWLQGFLVYTTMSIWVEDFQWNSVHPASGVVADPSVLKDHDNTFAAGLQALKMSPPDPVDGGRVLHGVAEVSLLGGLGCGELLLRKAVDDIVRTNTTIVGDETDGKYQYLVMQATEGSRPFYEKYGFKRVGALCRYRWAGYNKRGLNGTYINTKNGSAVTLTGKNTTIEAATTNRKRKKKFNSSSSVLPSTTTTTTMTSSNATTTQAKAARTGTASSSSSSLPSKTDSSNSSTAPLELYRGVPTESLADIGLVEWPEGWLKVVTQRQGGKSAGQSDSYWYSPIEQVKLRSIVSVKQFLLALRHANQDETSAKRTMHNFSVDPTTILPDLSASSSSSSVHDAKVLAGTKIVPPSVASTSTPPSPPPPPPPVGELVGYRHWTYTNESAKSLDLHGGPSVMMCLPLTEAYLLSTPFASSVQSLHDDQKNHVNNHNNTTTTTTTTVTTLLAPHIVKDKPLIQSLGNVNNTNSDDLVPTRKSSRRSSTGKDDSCIGFGGGVVDLTTPTLTATPPPPTGTSIIGGRRTSNRSKRCSSTLSNTDYVTTPYGQQQKIPHTGSGNPKHNSNTPPTKNAKRSRGSSSNRKRPRHTRKGSENSSSHPISAGLVVDAVKSAVSSLLTALSPATTSSAMALMNNTSTANTKNRPTVQQLKRNGSGQFISPANRISGHSLDCTKENVVGQSTTDENSLPSSSSTTTTTTLKKKKKKSKYRYPTTPPTRVSSRAVKACEILSVASHSTKTYSTDAMNEAMAHSNKRVRTFAIDEENDSKCSKKKARVAAPDDYMTASSLLPATSSQVQASSYLDDETTGDDSRRYSKRRSQLLVSIDKSKLCKQKMKSYPRLRIHYYNKIVFRKRSSILNSIIMDNDNNNSFTDDDPNSSSSSWFKQRAYNGGTMVDHRYEYCYYFVLHYDESASKVTLVPMIRNGLFTSGKYKTAKVGPRYRYQCNVLDTNRNWMIDVPADDYEVVDKAIMIMKTSFVASEAWDIYDNETADKTVDGTIAA